PPRAAAGAPKGRAAGSAAPAPAPRRPDPPRVPGMAPRARHRPGRGGAGTTPGLRGTGARLGRERGRVGSDAGPVGAVAVVVDTAAPDLDIQRARRFSRLGGPRADLVRQSV